MSSPRPVVAALFATLLVSTAFACSEETTGRVPSSGDSNTGDALGSDVADSDGGGGLEDGGGPGTDGGGSADGGGATDGGHPPTDSGNSGGGGDDAMSGRDTTGGGGGGMDSSSSTRDTSTGPPPCSGTTKRCSGTCTSRALDPQNCGSCGNTCSGSKVCNAGHCVSTCPYGMEPCNGRCVDKQTNDQHCGRCNQPCGSGKACGQGVCVDQIQLGDRGGACRGGGPPVRVNVGGNRSKSVCSGSLASKTFKWGICSCNALNLQKNILLDAYDSRKGPYSKSAGLGGSLGGNGPLTISKGEIWGAMWTSGGAGISSDVKLQVRQQLHSQGDVTFGTKGGVRGEAWVGGDVGTQKGGKGGPPGGGPPGGGGGGGPKIEFEKTLNVRPSSTIGPRIKTNGVSRGGVNVSTVCSRCKKSNRVPVQQIVHNHRTNNHNSAIGLKRHVLRNPGREVVLKLPCGRYYLSEIDVDKKVTIVATGNTALFIDGKIESTVDLTIKPSPAGELDVFVDGRVDLSNNIKLGSAAYPANMRFYVNGQWTFRNNGDFGAYIYAIPGGIATKNNLVLYGGMYTQDFRTKNNVDVHFDRAVLDVKNDCPEPGNGGGNPGSGGGGGSDAGTGGGGTSDAGTGGGGGSSDTGSGGGTSDAGSGTTDSGSGGTTCTADGASCSTDSECCSDLLCDNGVCGGTCSQSGGNCNGDSDCCSPLVCNSGTCETSTRKFLYESCQSDADCCSGTCEQTENLCVGS